ncbi:hypothetical protein Agub_g4242 [Astrephomene gubernaculifera]|uniref:Glycosyltransferase 61 catalytic domain-containing protein n=1 Tax=Astrephomene gubernaculifera TaxID=47775 RepID=A0AAD3HJQ2_9CHLO|nr:hypothetical protein Agub_g4242 [Astrephomene gubernaculifera]
MSLPWAPTCFLVCDAATLRKHVISHIVILMAVFSFSRRLSAEFVEYSDLLQSHPDNGLRLLALGDPYQSFHREPPLVLDPNFLDYYGGLGYLNVEFNARGDNTYHGSSAQYVAALRNASVCGSEGDVWDGNGRLYRANSWIRHPHAKLEAWRDEAESFGVRHYSRLASAVHRVSFMYFHFMTEVIPKVAKYAPFLAADPELKLLTYGSNFEQAWLRRLGIRDSQLVTFNPLYAYQADELLLTNPVNISRTPREDLLKALSIMGLPPPLPSNQRTSLVYVSRRLASDRTQTNEDSLLDALRHEATSHGLQLVVHEGSPDMGTDAVIDMFRRARVVMGPNGAGLAHMMFAAPATILIELMFINNTGMDLWHLTAALNQSYYMVPLPRSYWLDPGSDVPIEQAVSTLRWALGVQGGVRPACPRGSGPSSAFNEGSCSACPPGTFSTGYDAQCLECSPGWVAERKGSGYCRVCPSSTYANGSVYCVACPSGTLAAMPGSTRPDECLDPDTLAQVKQRWLPEQRVAAKVSAYYQAVTRHRQHNQSFDELPKALQNRVLSELDACSGGYPSSSYGCNIAPQSAQETTQLPSTPEVPWADLQSQSKASFLTIPIMIAVIGGVIGLLVLLATIGVFYRRGRLSSQVAPDRSAPARTGSADTESGQPVPATFFEAARRDLGSSEPAASEGQPAAGNGPPAGPARPSKLPPLPEANYRRAIGS